MLLLSKQDIQSVFSMQDAIEANKVAFRLMADGKVQLPLRTNIPAPKENGCFLFMPAYAEELDVASLKVVDPFPRNISLGLPSTPAQILLIDGTNGMVSAVLNGTYVTQLRTGAASGAAFDLLARKDCTIGAIIGAGGQAPTQILAMLAARPLQEIRICDRDPVRAQTLAQEMTAMLGNTSLNIHAVAAADEAVTDADLIVTVTTATQPVFSAACVKAGATISCVGAYQPHMQELDPAIFTRPCKLYFDSQEAVLAESGDILIPLEKGLLTPDDFTGDLGDVLLHKIPGRTDPDEIIVFETVGVAAQDLVVAHAIVEKARIASVGTVWDE